VPRLPSFMYTHVSHITPLERPVLVSSAYLLAISSLFNSLFKVLLIFPLRYLFAIGFSFVFSFRWNLPPASCTILKVHYSLDIRHLAFDNKDGSHTGLSPSLAPYSNGFIPNIIELRAYASNPQFEATVIGSPIFRLSFSRFTRRY